MRVATNMTFIIRSQNVYGRLRSGTFIVKIWYPRLPFLDNHIMNTMEVSNCHFWSMVYPTTLRAINLPYVFSAAVLHISKSKVVKA